MRITYLSILIFVSILTFGQSRTLKKGLTLKLDISKNDSASFCDLKKNDKIKIKRTLLIGIDDTELYVHFPGGDDELLKYINNNIHYPDSAIKAKVEGKVNVRFKIDTLGIISDIRIIHGLTTDIDNEVIYVISKMPNWVWDDSIKKNRRRITERTLPIIFKLTESEKNK